jgi:hypothetical protein
MPKLNYNLNPLNRNSMKRIAVTVVAFSLMTISCTESDKNPRTDETSKADESSKTNQPASESKSRPTRHSGVDSSITKVTGLSAKASGPTQIDLKWDSVPNAQGYWIYRDNYVPAIVVQRTNYADKGVSPGTTYNYAIAPVVNTVLGPKCVPVSVKTPR